MNEKAQIPFLWLSFGLTRFENFISLFDKNKTFYATKQYTIPFQRRKRYWIFFHGIVFDMPFCMANQFFRRQKINKQKINKQKFKQHNVFIIGIKWKLLINHWAVVIINIIIIDLYAGFIVGSCFPLILRYKFHSSVFCFFPISLL